MLDDLCVRYIEGKGRGVFAKRRFRKGEPIEQAPVLTLRGDEYELINQTSLRDYYFAWGDGACAIPLGLSMLYNHSDQPNAATRRNIETGVIEFIALRDIVAGEEICHTYVCPPWFNVIK